MCRYKGPGEQSGFGFELTFRLKKEPDENQAPMWPATLMNSLARYVFQTGMLAHTHLCTAICYLY